MLTVLPRKRFLKKELLKYTFIWVAARNKCGTERNGIQEPLFNRLWDVMVSRGVQVASALKESQTGKPCKLYYLGPLELLFAALH